jgi:hypothetical protein
MNFREETTRLVSKILLCLAVASGSVIVGCSSEVGSSPTTKSQVKEFVVKESEKSQFTGRGGQPGKGTQGPMSIKKKLFNSESAQTK